MYKPEREDPGRYVPHQARRESARRVPLSPNATAHPRLHAVVGRHLSFDDGYEVSHLS